MLCVAGAITMDPFSLPQATFPWDGMYMVEVIANGWLFSSHWKQKDLKLQTADLFFSFAP